MILEHALLRIEPGESAAFEAAMQQARPLIEVSTGFLGMEVRRAVETADCYLLLVRWASIADHRDGFRRSERYRRWRELLHGYYAPMPNVDYFGDPL